MKNSLIKAVTAAVILTLSLTSCGGKSSSSEETASKGNELVGDAGDDVNVSFEDMIYGASIFQLNKETHGVPATTEVDSRFYSEEEARLICNYFWAICSKDGELFRSVSYPPYLELTLSDYEYSSPQEYMEAYYNEYYTVIGTDYTFSYIYAVDCKNEDSGYNFSRYDQVLKEAAPEANITSRKVVPVYLNYSAVDGSGGGEVIHRDTYDFPMGTELGNSDFIWICIYEIDGQSYIIS